MAKAQYGSITLKGKHPLMNHKVGTKVRMTAHGVIEAHEMQPDYENSTDEVSENAYPPKVKKSKGPKRVQHTRIKILRTDDEEPASQATPLDQVISPDSQN